MVVRLFPSLVTPVPTAGDASPEGKQQAAGLSGFGDRLGSVLACSQTGVPNGLKGELSGAAGYGFLDLHV